MMYLRFRLGLLMRMLRGDGNGFVLRIFVGFCEF